MTDTFVLFSDGEHVVKVKAVDNSDGTYSLATVPAIESVTITSTNDSGPSWTPIQKYTSSTNLTTAAALTDAPASGKQIIVDDVLVSVDTDMELSLQMETSANVLASLLLSAGSPQQLTFRNGLRADVADKKIFGKASVAGKVRVTVSWHEV